MNWTHLRAFVWVRWRLAVNQITRSGSAGAAIAVLLTALLVPAMVLTLVIGFLVGFLALSTGSPRAVMVVWDGAIVGFVFFWMVGLVSELQRSDALSLDRFLHLPVSPTSAFLINYLGSSVSLSLLLMLPAMIGLSAGLVLSRGPGMLVLFPLVATFFLMMTALAYQFRGWLASMMANPRRRRAIMAIVPALFALAFQLPSMWNVVGPGSNERRASRDERRRPATAERNVDDDYESARLVNMIAPPGWLAYGAGAAAEGRVWPALGGVLGMGLIGAFSLRRAYGTTLRLYRADFDTKRRPSRPAIPAGSGLARRVPPSTSFVEARLPWTSERVSSIAVAGFRSWMRAPEMKMTLLTPIIMLIVFSRMFIGQSATAPEFLRPLAASGLAGFILIVGLVGPAGNQFGYDRASFRAFVLGPVPRRDLLFGKNLSLLPFGLVMMGTVVGVSHWFNPMRLDHFIGVLFQLFSLYLLFCLGANLMSIVAPMSLKPGSGVPTRHQGLRAFVPMVFLLMAPLLLGLTMIPLGIEAILWAFDWFPRFPAFLVFAVVQAVVAMWLYRLVIARQGRLLQRRECQILEIVGARAE